LVNLKAKVLNSSLSLFTVIDCVSFKWLTEIAPVSLPPLSTVSVNLLSVNSETVSIEMLFFERSLISALLTTTPFPPERFTCHPFSPTFPPSTAMLWALELTELTTNELLILGRFLFNYTISIIS
jgi:hypothetical protein